jgi:hypothetical protein
MRIEVQFVYLFLAASTKDNRGVREELLVRLDHELDGGGPLSDDQVWLAILILADIPFTKVPLVCVIRKQSYFQRLVIELNLIVRF